jgi:hypothetical protein
MKGPIDYIIVGFTGLKFDGSILKAIGDAVDAGTIRLLALSAIAKQKDGDVVELNIADVGDGYLVEFGEKHQVTNELITEDDRDEVGELLEEDTAAGLFIVEHLWALPIKKAIADSGGFLIADGRIHPEAAEELEAQTAGGQA